MTNLPGNVKIEFELIKQSFVRLKFELILNKNYTKAYKLCSTPEFFLKKDTIIRIQKI